MRNYHLPYVLTALSLGCMGVGLFFTQTPRTATAANAKGETLSVRCSTDLPTKQLPCPKRDRHDICHFGKVEYVTKDGPPHNRYNVFCEATCITPDSTCWVTGLPAPEKERYTINWLGKKPTNIYRHKLSREFLVEAVFTP